jgi:hypothetical protein
MANDLELIEMFLRQGSNSLEFDLKFTKEGELVEFTHGFPCDLLQYCNRKTEVKTFLHYFSKLEHVNKACHLAIFDLKIREVDSKFLEKAGGLFAEALQKYFFVNNNQMKIVLSAPSLSKKEFFDGFVSSPYSRNFIDKVSFGTSSEVDARNVAERLRLRYRNIPTFYGAGTTSWASWIYPKVELMINAVKYRDLICQNENLEVKLNKIWYWTAGEIFIDLSSRCNVFIERFDEGWCGWNLHQFS